MTSLLELLKQKKQDMAASRRSRTAKLADGSSRWRILGSWRGADQQFWHDFGQHFVKDAAGKIVAIYMCVDKTYGKPCSVCEAIKQGASGATDEATLKIISDAKSGARVLVSALHLDGPEPNKVQILELPPTVFEQIVSIITEWAEAGHDVLGPNGKDIIINRSGTGIGTKYSAQVAAKATVVPASICEKLHDLDEYVNQESGEVQTRAINAVRAVSGLLPAPSAAGAGLPLAARAGMVIEDDSAVVTAPPPRAAAAPAAPVFEDVPDLAVVSAPPPRAAAAAPVASTPAWEEPIAAAPAPVKAAAPVAAPAPVAAAPAASTGDDELDNLLAELG